MRAQNNFVRHAGWDDPGERQVGLVFQSLDGGRDARRAFRMAGGKIAGTFFIGDDFHKRILTTDGHGLQT